MDKKTEKQIADATLNTIKYHTKNTIFKVVEVIEDGVAIFSPSDRMLREIFNEPWLYSSYDEPLLIDGDKIKFEIDDFYTRTIINIQKVD